MSSEPTSLARVLAASNALLQAGRPAAARVVATGFRLLDTHLDGGLRCGELCLLGGVPGSGTTTFALQAARYVVANGGTAVYFTSQHDVSTLLQRVLACDAAEQAGVGAVSVRRIRQAMEIAGPREGDLADRLAGVPGGPGAVQAVRNYGTRFIVHTGLGARTDPVEITTAVRKALQLATVPPLVVVDHLHGIRPPAAVSDAEERVATLARGLKDLALELQVPVLSVVAPGTEGLAPHHRLRMRHLRGAWALAPEADIVLVLNDKVEVVSASYLAQEREAREPLRGFVVLSVEKNRSGTACIDIELRKRFEQGRFDPDGAPVADRLLDDSDAMLIPP